MSRGIEGSEKEMLILSQHEKFVNLLGRKIYGDTTNAVFKDLRGAAKHFYVS